MFYRSKKLLFTTLFKLPITVEILCKAKNLSGGYVEDLNDIENYILESKYETYEILCHSIINEIPTAVKVTVSDNKGNTVICEENDR